MLRRTDGGLKLANLWDEAVEKLSEDDRQQIDFGQDDKRYALDKMLALVQARQRDKARNQLGIRHKNGKPIILRDVFSKLVSCINKFKEIGDVVVQYDPGHAALPWAAVRLVMQAVIGEHEIHAAMLEGLEHVADLIARFAWVESVYLDTFTPQRTQLQDALINLYVAVLKFLAKARHHYIKHTHERILTSLVRTKDEIVERYMQKIDAGENLVCRIAQLIDGERLTEIWRKMDSGFTSLDGRIGEISQQIDSLQMSVDKHHQRSQVERDTVLEWIDAISTYDDYQVALQARVEGSCQWILGRSEIINWARSDPKSHAPNVLWIIGKPGAGKTIVTASLVEHLRETEEAPVCYFFCFYSHIEKRKCDQIIRSWISQLVKSNEIAFQAAKEVFEHKESQRAAHAELWQIFQRAIQFRKVYLIVDGFDECAREDSSIRNFSHLDARASFLKRLDETVADTHTRVLLVSREDSNIREQLRVSSEHRGSSARHATWMEYSITKADTAEDIENFSSAILEQRLSHRLAAELKEELMLSAAEKSDGMFLWIKLLYSHLPRSSGPKMLRARILSTPGGLNEAYDRELRTILDLEQEDRKRALAILRWTLFARQPLTVRQLYEALIVEQELPDIDHDLTGAEPSEEDCFFDKSDLPEVWDYLDIQDRILRLCGSLVELRGSETNIPIQDQTIHFVHFSVNEYLIRTDPFADERVAHHRLGITCLKYMCYNDFIQKDCLSYEYSKIVERYAFLKHAALCWTFHTDRCRPFSAALTRWCNRLFDPMTSRWLSCAKVIEQNSWVLLRNDYSFRNISPLSFASFLGLTETMQWLLDEGEEVNPIEGSQGCPIEIASMRGQRDAITLLLSRGANPNFSGERYYSAVRAAFSNGFLNIVELLLDHGADINARDGCGRTLLQIAAFRGDNSDVKVLHDHGADLEASDNKGLRAIHSAVIAGQEATVKLLLDLGAHIASIDFMGRTALHHAAFHAPVEVIEVLLTYGIDSNITDEDGWTALHMAANIWKGRVSKIQVLLQHGANKWAKNRDGLTPADIARRKARFHPNRIRYDDDNISLATASAEAISLLEQ